MRTQTLHKRELFARALRAIGLGVFAVFGITALLLAHTPVKSLADTNSTINFQARLQTSAGAIAPDGYYNVEFKLYNAPSTGSALWTEDYTYGSPDHRIRVVNGYLSANLGSLTSFSGINWDQDLYLTMNIGGATTTPSWDGEMNPRLKVTSVPYAFRAGQLAQYNSTTGYTSTLGIAQPTGGNQTFQIQDQGAGGSYNILTQNQSDNRYIQLQSSTPGTAQTGNINITGSAIASILQASTSVLTTLLDTPSSGGTLAVGTTNATGGINLNQNTTIASGKTLSVQGATSITDTNDASAFTITGAARLLTVDTSSTRVTIGAVGACTGGGGKLCVNQSNLGTGNVVNTNNTLSVISTGATSNIVQNLVLTDTSTSQSNTNTVLQLDSTATTNSSATVNSILAQVATGQAGNFIQLQNGSTTELTVTNAGALSVNSTINSVSGFKFNGTAGSTTTCTSGNVLQNAVIQGGIVTAGTCVANGGTTTLQNVYDNSSTTPVITLSSTGKGIAIKDASTTVGGNLFAIQNNAASTNYFAVTTSGASVAGSFTVSNGLTVSTGGASVLGTTTINTSGSASTTIGNSGSTTTIGGALTVNGATTLTGSGILQSLNSTNYAINEAGSISNGTGILNGSHAIAVSGKYAYVVSKTAKSFAVVDVSNPASPTVIGSLTDATHLSDVKAITIDGQYAYLASNGNNALEVINISNPYSPTFVTELVDGTNLNGFKGIASQGRYVYAAVETAGKLVTIDVSSPAHPKVVGSTGTNLAGAKGIYVAGKYAYVATGNGGTQSLTIVDISNPASPTEVGAVIDTTKLSLAQSVYVSGHYAYVASASTAGYLVIIDVSNPASPSIVGSITNSDTNKLQSVQVIGNYAYGVALGSTKALVFDVSNPASPTELTSLTDSSKFSQAQNLVISGRYGYVVNDQASTGYFTSIDLSGSSLVSANIGAAQVGNLQVSEDANIVNNTNIGGSLQVAQNISASGSLSVNGGASFINTTDSTNAFQIQNAAGTSNLLVADTTDTRIGIGVGTPGYTLDVGGDINTSGVYRVGTTSGSTTTCSSGNVLQNAVIQGGIITGGSCVANGGGVAPTLQNAYDNSSTTPNIALSSTGKGITISDASTTVGGNLFAIQNNGASTQYLAVTTSGASVAGTFSATGQISTTATGGVALSISGAPTNSATSSLIRIGNAISGGNTASNGGTYIGLNAPSSGAGSAADLIDLQANGSSQLKVNASGDFSIGKSSGSQVSGSCTLGCDLSLQTTSTSILMDDSTASITLTGLNNLSGPTSISNSGSSGSWTPLSVLQSFSSATVPVATFKGGATPGSGADLIQGKSSTNAVLFQVKNDGTVNSVAGYQLNGTAGVTVTACTGGQVLTNIGVTGGIITSAGSCAANGGGTAPTLQDVYTNSTDGVIAEAGTKGLTVKDASSTVGNILQVQNSGATSTYFSVTANGAQAAAFDAQPSSALTIGGANATSITVGSGSVTTTFSGNVTLASGKTFSLAGAETLTTTSSTALKIQDGSNNVLLTADTSAMQVVVGSTSNGVILSSSGISLAGTAQKTKSIVLMPEFGGAVLDAGSGSNNTGTMTSGYDNTNRMNYYKWTTTQGTNQSYDVDVQVPIPSDFSSWGSTPLSVTAYTSNTTNGTVTVQVVKSNGSADSHFSSFQSATPGSTTTWTTTNFSTFDSSNYTAGDYLTIRIRLQSPASGDVRLGKIVLTYKNAY